MCRKISLQGSWHGKPVPPTFLLYLFFLMPGHILEMDKVKKMETNCVGRVVAAYILDSPQYILHLTNYFVHSFRPKILFKK